MSIPATLVPLLDGRLPSAVAPTRYDVTLSVDLDHARFSGAVAIQLQVREAVRAITLHALDLEIHEAMVESGGVYHTVALSQDAESETLTLALSREIVPGHAMVALTFSGSLNQQMKGLYEAQSGPDRYAFTQCEATDARRVFPCFDEPALKARFKITAVVPDHLVVLSNMDVEAESVDPRPAVESEPPASLGRARGAGASEANLAAARAPAKVGTCRKTVTFAETPPMSTYLVALAVAKLECRDAVINGTRVAVYATPGQLALTDFALDVMRDCLPRLNGYFNLPYPLAKLDLVAVPDFAMGAMENWGAMFFRESRVLLDPSRASAHSLRDVANVITHEVVHQWFGNLVTMEWWDDLWLNESFATWLACKIVDEWRPEWQSWVEFARDKQVPLGVDALTSTRPISSKVRTAAEAEEMFDALTYEKGASVLRMLEQFLGEAVFRRGIRDYITSHQFGNAPATDLWNALEAASGHPVPLMAQDWFARPGFPMVAVCAVGSTMQMIEIEQRRFWADPAIRPPSERPWAIPVTLAFEDDEGVRQHRLVMTGTHTTIALPAVGPVRWVYANAGEQGFYRTRYSRPLRVALTASISKLAPEERLGLLDNIWALVKKGDLPIGEWLDLVTRFRGDETRIVIEGLAGYLVTLGDRMVLETDRPLWARFVEEFHQPLVALLGWDARPREGDEPKLARAAMLWALGSLAKPASLIHEMEERLARYWSDQTSLDPTLVTVVLRLCARVGGTAHYGRYVERYHAATTPEERDRYLAAFGEFAAPSLTPTILALILSDAIRGQDIWKPLRGLLTNPATQGETWAFIRTNWPALRQKGGSVGAQRIIGGTKALWSAEWLDEVTSFFSDPANRVASAERTLTQTIETIRLGLACRQTQQARLSAWLHQAQGGSVKRAGRVEGALAGCPPCKYDDTSRIV